MVVTDTPSCHLGGVSSYTESQHFAVEALQLNVLVGGCRWNVVVCYLIQNNASTLERVVAAIGQHPRGTEILFTGDFNADLAVPDGKERDETIKAAMETEGLEDMAEHFLPHH